jgi:hypothetical protein
VGVLGCLVRVLTGRNECCLPIVACLWSDSGLFMMILVSVCSVAVTLAVMDFCCSGLGGLLGVWWLTFLCALGVFGTSAGLAMAW